MEELQPLIPGYELQELLGRGGMGAVYKARQQSLDRLVAIKILPPPPAEDPFHAAERFEHEARAMARLAHPGVVGVHDFGQTEDQQYFYFVMEHIDGSDLAQVIAGSGQLSPEDAVVIVSDVCKALAYAHEHGVIHRDIKPSNILLDGDGRVKVADFGLAHVADPAQTQLTRTNLAMGTPDYAAPELLDRLEPADGRADLYSVGVMLYQILTGEVPRGMFKLPSEKRAELDGRFDEIICRAMEPEPDKRYQTALEVRRDLEDIRTVPLSLVGEEEESSAQTDRSPRFLWGGIVAVLLLVGLFIVVPKVLPDRTETPSASEQTRGAEGIPTPPGGEGWENLLKRLDGSKHALMDPWRMVNGELRTPSSSQRHQMIELPIEEALVCYDLRLQLTRHEGEEAIAIAFRRGTQAGILTLDSRTGNPDPFMVQLAHLEDPSVHSVRHKGTPFLPPNQLHTLVLKVRPDILSVVLNEVEVLRWAESWSSMSQRDYQFLPPDVLEGRPVFGVGASSSDVTFHRMDLRRLDQVVEVNDLPENKGNIASQAKLSSNDDSFSTRYVMAGVTDGRVSDGPAGEVGYVEGVHTVFDSFGLANWVCFTNKTNEIVLEFAKPVDLRELATYVTSAQRGGTPDADRMVTAVNFWVETVNDEGRPKLVKTVLPEDTDDLGGFERVSCQGPWQGVFKLIYSFAPVSNERGNEVRVAEVLALEVER